MVSYSQIFDTYLEMNKFFRMDLFDIKTLHTWIKKLDFDKFFNTYGNFFVFLEYLYKKKYVIPFFIVGLSDSKKKLSTLNLKEIATNYIYFNSWENLKKSEFINFIDQNIVKKFSFKDRKYYRLKELFENKIFYYFYHPIQFIQILTLIYSLYKNKINLISIKDFNEYYKKRWSELEFEVVLQSSIYSAALKKRLITKEDILSRIESKCSRTEETPFRRYSWLTPEFFNIWLKLESIFLPKYYSPYLIPSYSIYDVNIPETEWEEIYEKENDFRLSIYENRLKIFNSEEMKTIQGIKWSMKRIYHNFFGLEDWTDLILEMKRSKKDNLKGLASYFVNIFQIIRTLEIADWELKANNEGKKKKKPIFLCDEKNYPDYRLRLLIDYELLAEKIIIIYAEGETEYNILKDWLEEFRIRGHFDKIEIQNIEGKTKTSNTFGYIVKNFKNKNHFLFLDADNNDKKDERLNKLIKESIPTDSVHFWIPDFVTEHFEVSEILKGYIIYTKELGIEVSIDFLKKLEISLVDAKKNNTSFEKTIEKIEYEFRDTILFPSFSKTKFSKILSKIIIRKCKKGFKPKFEIVLDGFFSRIQQFINDYYERKYPK